VPTPVIPFAKAEHIINIILLGNDVATPQGGRTDSLILVSINRQTETATMLSLPRDLFVVIPGWQMTRINLALPHGHGVNYPGGGGSLIKDTIEYNLGIPVDYYARIGFNGFKEAVDAVGGIEMVVNCSLTDWRLISPELDPEVEENWEQFTLSTGVHEMDGDLALWYARSRLSTNDFERGLRQQRILQAIFSQSLDTNLLAELPDLWQAYQHNIETDMGLPLLLELAAIAPTIAENGIRHLTLPLAALQGWREPATGGAVQLLQWETAEPTLNQLMQPPALNRAANTALTVAVVTKDEILYRQTADNLAWYGFVPKYELTDVSRTRTEIVYYGRNRKGSYDWLLSWLFHQEAANIITATDETSDVAYRVWLGEDANPCLAYLQAPSAGSAE
jgi:LCP family protein required for cell wall assembly